MINKKEKLTKKIRINVTKLYKKNTKNIGKKYFDYVMMLRVMDIMYKSNIENFEKYTMRLNSVISSTLALEYRINDIQMQSIIIPTNLAKTIECECKSLSEKIEKLTHETTSFLEKTRESDVNLNIENFKNRLIEKTKKDIEKIIENEIERLGKDYYFIGNISKDKDMKELMVQICQAYIENELIYVVREEIYKKCNIKNKLPVRLRCFNIGAYNVTSYKVKKVISMSKLNYLDNMIEDETLNLFNIFLNFENSTNKYQDILNKYKEKAIKEIKTKKTEYCITENLIKNYAKIILKELR